MSKKYMDIRVTGYEPELVEFLKVLKSITTLGRYGSSRTVEVNVDGDGSGRLDFQLINNESDLSTVEPWDYKEFSENEESHLKLSIGE